MDGVEQERHGRALLEPEALIELHTHALRVHGEVARQALFLSVVVEPEMRGFEHRPVERCVLDLVLAEHLGRSGNRGDQERECDQARARMAHGKLHQGIGFVRPAAARWSRSYRPGGADATNLAAARAPWAKHPRSSAMCRSSNDSPLPAS